MADDKTVIGVALLGAAGIAVYYYFKTKEEDGENGNGNGEPPTTDIAIGEITVTPTEGYPGAAFALSFPVTNNSELDFQGEIEVLIRQGANIGTGDVLDTKQMTLYLPAGQTGNISLTHVGTDVGGDTERDVDVNINAGGKLFERDFFNVFRVLTPTTDFAISDLLVNPPEGLPGTVFGLHFTIINNSGVSHTGEAELLVRQGVLIGTGEVLDTPPRQSFTLGPGEFTQFNINHTGQKTYTGNSTEDERDVDVNVYVGGELVAERDWRYNADGFIFGILEPTEVNLTVHGILSNPMSGLPGTLFNIITQVNNNDPIAHTFVLELGIVDMSNNQRVRTMLYPTNITVGPNTTIQIPMQWVGTPAGVYGVDGNVIIVDEVVAHLYQPGVIIVQGVESGTFGVAPYDWPDLFPYPEATQWGLVWTTPDGDYSSGILARGVPALMANVPLTGQMTLIFYAPGYTPQYGPTAQVTLENGASYWYYWTTNQLIKAS